MPEQMKVNIDFLKNGLKPVNIGVQDFGLTLETQGVEVIYVNWTPPAAGDQKMIDLLDDLL
jgi:hypothetical protein